VISVSILLGLNCAELEEKFSTIQPMKAELFYFQRISCKTKTIFIPHLLARLLTHLLARLLARLLAC